MTPLDFIPISEAVARVVGRVMRRQREMADEAAKPEQNRKRRAVRPRKVRGADPAASPTREAGTDHPAGWRFR